MSDIIESACAVQGDRNRFAPDDAEWLQRNSDTPCRVRPYRSEDRDRLHYTSFMGCETETLWLTYVFRNGVHIAHFFAGPSSRWFPPLIDRVSFFVNHYLSENPEWGRNPQ